MDLIKVAESAYAKEMDFPEFGSGDTITVSYRIKEGEKERVQVFQGDVIAKKGKGINGTFTVRKVSAGIGVERIFPLHSPNVVDVKPIRSGKTRRAKLYYLRKRTGKGVRLAQRHSKHTVRK